MNPGPRCKPGAISVVQRKVMAVRVGPNPFPEAPNGPAAGRPRLPWSRSEAFRFWMVAVATTALLETAVVALGAAFPAASAPRPESAQQTLRVLAVAVLLPMLFSLPRALRGKEIPAAPSQGPPDLAIRPLSRRNGARQRGFPSTQGESRPLPPAAFRGRDSPRSRGASPRGLGRERAPLHAHRGHPHDSLIRHPAPGTRRIPVDAARPDVLSPSPAPADRRGNGPAGPGPGRFTRSHALSLAEDRPGRRPHRAPRGKSGRTALAERPGGCS